MIGAGDKVVCISRENDFGINEYYSLTLNKTYTVAYLYKYTFLCVVDDFGDKQIFPMYIFDSLHDKRKRIINDIIS